MRESNYERFNALVEEFLKNDDTYKLQIEKFRDYLEEYNLKDRVFNLYESNIDEFFEYAIKRSIGTQSQLVSHIAALKALFNFFLDNNLKFSDLNGYMGNPAFRERYKEKVDEVRNKGVLSIEMINKILCTMDSYIDEHKNVTLKKQKDKLIFYNVLIARLFVKISMLVPLKTTQILELVIGDVYDDSWRSIICNNVEIKVPNNLRKDIMFTLNYVNNKYGTSYNPNESLFGYLYRCDGKKNNTDTINSTFPRVYKALGLDEMLETVLRGKKRTYIYPAESYKKTAIINMICNGANIVYLTKLTGLDIKTLLADLDYDELVNGDVNRNLNNSLIACGYYEYL